MPKTAKKFTLEDIAKLARTSKATVSLALNDCPGVSPVTRRRVLEIAEQNGYVAQRRAPSRAAARKSIRLVAVSKPETSDIHNFGTSFFAELINSIQTCCAQLGYNLIYSAVAHGDFISAVNAQESEQPTQGVILIGTYLNDEEIGELGRINSRLVVIDRPCHLKALNTVCINNFMGGYAAGAYLAGLGHRLIGYVQSVSRVENLKERFSGFERALCDRAIDFSEERVFRGNCYLPSGVNSLCERLTAARELPTAMFCENDYNAFCLIGALTRMGLNVPRDVSVVGFDNVPESVITTPRLTTVSVDRASIARAAVNRLHELINGAQGMSLETAVNVTLLERDSTAPPSAGAR